MLRGVMTLLISYTVTLRLVCTICRWGFELYLAHGKVWGASRIEIHWKRFLEKSTENNLWMLPKTVLFEPEAYSTIRMRVLRGVDSKYNKRDQVSWQLNSDYSSFSSPRIWKYHDVFLLKFSVLTNLNPIHCIFKTHVSFSITY